MAIQISFEDGSGVIHLEAYARIQKVIIENPASGQKNVCVEVCIYASKAAREAGKVPVWGPQGYQVHQPCEVQPEVKEGEAQAVDMVCAVDLDNVTVADVYTWLKTQDAYLTSKDV